MDSTTGRKYNKLNYIANAPLEIVYTGAYRDSGLIPAENARPLIIEDLIVDEIRVKLTTNDLAYIRGLDEFGEVPLTVAECFPMAKDFEYVFYVKSTKDIELVFEYEQPLPNVSFIAIKYLPF